MIKTKILIIEDDNEINDMLKRLLTQNGYDTASAYFRHGMVACS